MKKGVIALFLIVGLLLMQAEVATAYGSQDSGSIYNGAINYTFSNYISPSKYTGDAKTVTSSQLSGVMVSVSATFYWVDYEKQTFGSNNKHRDDYANVTVYADSLTGTGKYYYQVDSHLAVSYGNASYSNDLSTFVP